MKILRVKLILLTLVLSFLGCSSKKKGAFLLPLSQAVQDSIASENSSPTAPSNPSNTSTSSSSTSNTQSTDQKTQSNDSNNQTQNPLPNVDFQSGASSVFRG
ncbi:MAG: hypothetical protein N3A69_10895, partial [Leptospiraceae bacterium]|nr:hypothetical protein [Leptospiraceae bacterium]